MVEFKDIRSVYFIGIGGIGMSALARYFKFHGKAVSGYDKTATSLTHQLEQEGIAVHYEENLDLIPKDVDLVVYTPAVPADHKELVYYQQQGKPLLKRSEVLGLITRSSFNICVAGTHGKTTITTMIAHILRHTGYGCNAFLGGIAVNYNSNYWSDERNVCVVEADEYDRSFLRLSPDIAVITAMDADHLDIYGTTEAVQQAFIEFSGCLKPGGLLLSKEGLARGADLKGDHHLTYGLAPGADFYATEIRIDQGDYLFRMMSSDWSIDKVVLPMGGRHNVENVVAAIAIAHRLGIAGDKIVEAVAAFRGVKRRFEFIIKQPNRVYIDDYAHHPQELKALISGAKELFGGMKCTVIFQPHLFTRTRDFAEGFAASLDEADEVILLPIYPAREQPIAGVTSELIAGMMKKAKVTITDKQEVLAMIKEKAGDRDTAQLLITAGAGDIDMLIEPIRQLLEV
ncbi:UDP-N-acetylmuramate--L-alanine ligase [Puia dinghuensis]|uniref:UDP-N-acetylmuramate--L-alanine ligase n=1 Tax=Puia dinghuensis TaxID=1792502 RepID=A0A8J2UE87_9BACT|nr:UDP-N-acetylmuramate--L-alanine ligase [Puia dinghuensis]GGB05780.1 UDP-N-acetylmuramate--L-alanine ligase [Puia dinghuensis]